FSLPIIIKTILDKLQGYPLPSWIPESIQSASPLLFIFSFCGLYLLATGLIAFIRYWWRVHLIWSTFPLFHEIRQKFFRHIQNLDREFFKAHKVGDLLSGLTTDTENLRMTLSIGALMLIDALINFVFFPFLLWRLNPSMAMIVVPPLVLVSVLVLFLSHRLSKGYEEVQEITASLSGRAFEIISGIRVIKAFRKEEPIHHDFVSQSGQLRDASKRVAKYQSIFGPGLNWSLAFTLVFVLIYGGNKVLKGELPLSNLVAFQLYLANMDWPMLAIGWFIQLYRQSQASQKRIQNFESRANPLLVADNLLCRDPLNLFEMESADYSFGGLRRFSFTGLNLKVKAGGWIGLTGPVGSGKTTFLELLSRQRDPTTGAIYWKGQNLKVFSPNQIAEKILYVPQEAFMFSRSIRKNLTLGMNDDFSDDILWELLRDLSFDEANLAERGGLNIRLGERGVNLSGGQRQRISLGRALVRAREVYLLDDLFSHVDAETESKLLLALKKHIPTSATVFLVSQRIETLKKCREVIVLNNGKIDFQGTFEDVLSSNDFFKRLHSLQNVELPPREGVA
ncbi:MAG: ABC-type multidrug/protein/lipid transport system, ATPase component, partial [Bacteriovoracaceae bacterium]|nr:ABC-type multidrug/protein/lipid transport system, ATPase component [Bacteriovoracaceae bacterium]